jgi:cysteine sulfinate desulfinase/cysteine desulfurase-like protein
LVLCVHWKAKCFIEESKSKNKPFHVIAAIGLNPVQARGALRISLGRYNTEEEVDYFLDSFPEVLAGLKSIVSLLM